MRDRRLKVILYKPVTENFEHVGIVPSHVVGLATYVEQHAGVDMHLLDVQTQFGLPLNKTGAGQLVALSTRELLDRIVPGRTILGVSITSAQDLVAALPVLRRVRENSDVPIVLGGFGAALARELILTQYADFIDAVVVGPGEEPLTQLCRSFKQGRIESRDIPGVAWRDESVIRFVRNTRGTPPLDRLNWDLLPHKELYGCITATASYGCRHRCVFCNESLVAPIAGCVDPDTFRQHLRDLRRHFPHIDYIWLTDPNVGGGNPEKARAALASLRRMDYRVLFFSRCDSFQQDFLEQGPLDDWMVFFGVESADPVALSGMRKTKDVQHYLARLTRAFRQCLERNVMPVLAFIVNFPGQPVGSALRTLEFTQELTMRWDTGSSVGFVISPSLFQINYGDLCHRRLATYRQSGCLFESFFPKHYFGVPIHPELQLTAVTVAADPDIRHAEQLLSDFSALSRLTPHSKRLLRRFGYCNFEALSRRFITDRLPLAVLNQLDDAQVFGE